MPISQLIRKLESIAEISDEDREALNRLVGRVRILERGEDIVSIGERPRDVTLVTSGLLCRHKDLEGGKRQIMSFHIPGDIPDLHSLFIQRMDHSLGALTRSEVLTIPHDQVLDVLSENWHLTQVLWRETLIDAAAFREWVVSVGRRQAQSRIAHLLCEVITRMQAVGLMKDDQCSLPITQADIADATGLTNVHVNRTLRELRANGLIDIGHRTLTALDRGGLERLAEFDPLYLHLRDL